jgi:ketosteroid isomerase-like protein
MARTPCGRMSRTGSICSIDFRIEPVELIDAGENRVVAVLRFGGRAKLSGVETDQILGAVFEIRDGKIARGREYATRKQALDAAGLAE